MASFDFLVVGAGFSGVVCAERLAHQGYRVCLVEKRGHIGGNAFDKLDDHGVLIHPYGPHIFHTNSQKIYKYLSQFTGWRPYEHRVLASVGGENYPIPINRTTINKLYGWNLSQDEVADYLSRVRCERYPVKTSEDVVLNSVGKDLCDIFFAGYTKKQWGMSLAELTAGVAARIPTRTNDDDRYFTDLYQVMPLHGYTPMFERMLDSPRIDVRLNTPWSSSLAESLSAKVIFTGPIDSYFNFQYGALPYRSISFEHQHFSEIDLYQEVGTVNYPLDNLYTRITEFKHLSGQDIPGTSIVREYPCWDGDPYYPVPSIKNNELYDRYRSQADLLENVYFVGRLAEYKYFNMDQAIAAALQLVSKIAHDSR